MSEKGSTYYVKIRTYTGGEFIATVWVMDQDQAAHFSLVAGEMSVKRAEGLVTYLEALGVPIVREVSPLPGVSIYAKKKEPSREPVRGKVPARKGLGLLED